MASSLREMASNLIAMASPSSPSSSSQGCGLLIPATWGFTRDEAFLCSAPRRGTGGGAERDVVSGPFIDAGSIWYCMS